ncbi:MAG: DUF11 domain-containing protein [Deltaproteobacteria bacterium]|nr:DUF11 domain-containing protein [Deltaproteobacteria bacterium]
MVVASVGSGNSTTSIALPANYSSIIATSIVDSAKTRSSSANYNTTADEVDIMAPGTSVITMTTAGGYGATSGGAAASAHVAGVAALIYSHCARKRAITPAEVRTAILGNTELIAGKLGYDREYGNGLLRADLALEAFPECFVVAQNGSGSVMQGRSVGINLSAAGGEGDTLTYQVQTQPAHGSVTLSGNTATYTPAAGYTGGDSFTFRALDPKPHISNTATVTVTVTPNTAPSVSTPTVMLAGVAASLSATASDADPGEVFTATIDWGDGGGMQTASVSGPNVTGSHTYTTQGAKTVTVCVRDLAQIPACASTTINVSAATTSNSADLVLSINTIPAETPLNQAVVITLSAKNLGPASANNAKVTTTLPTGSAIEPATSASCAAAAGGIVCSTSQLAPDASLAFTIAATAASAGEWHFSASATSDENDPVSSNNTVSADVDIHPANLGSLNVSTTPKRGCQTIDPSGLSVLVVIVLAWRRRRS